jgi:hypothetical protein
VQFVELKLPAAAGAQGPCSSVQAAVKASGWPTCGSGRSGFRELLPSTDAHHRFYKQSAGGLN